MPRTFKEKLAYNKALSEGLPFNGFAVGYVQGAAIYADYPAMSAAEKQRTKEFIDGVRREAKGSEICKGVMCGYRDAANERKRKSGPAPPALRE